MEHAAIARALQGLSFGALPGTAVAALAELEGSGDHARATLRAVGGAVVFAMLGASALAQLGTRHWRARRQLLSGAGCLAGAVLIGLAGASLLVTFVHADR